jgi:hypothetical protein
MTYSQAGQLIVKIFAGFLPIYCGTLQLRSGVALGWPVTV